jgi:hypothetical protein
VRIDVSGRQFTFPPICACCNGSADAEMTVSASNSTGKRANAWDIPYCRRCVKHVKAADTTVVLSWVCGIASVVPGAVLWWAGIPYLGIPIAVVGLVGTVLLYSKLMAKADGIRGPDCVCLGKAVAYLGWHGTLHEFEIASPDYARAFMAANQRKLVNLSHEARELLESRGHVPPPDMAQSPRRYVR